MKRILKEIAAKSKYNNNNNGNIMYRIIFKVL